MEAPEKIYVHRTVHLGLLAASEINITGNDVEYTRTDAFIEKACDAYCKVCKMPNCRRNECKFISEFINYMKGE